MLAISDATSPNIHQVLRIGGRLLEFRKLTFKCCAIICYPHMLIGRVWIYRLLFVCLFVFCTVTDFSAEGKASGVKFCTAVHRRPRQGIFHFCELCSREAQNRKNRPARPCCNVILLGLRDSHTYQVRAACGRRIGMCGYTLIPEDGRTC